ncbi:MAG: carbon-nitrogen hydrolase family protein [Promethearchaeota archaeon]
MINVACIQPKINSDRDKCYSEIEYLLERLLKEFNSCEIACLPERWVPFQPEFSENFQEERGQDYEFIKELAREHEINILTGAIWEKRASHKKPWITCYFINDKGVEIGRQDKLHLYTYERKYFMPGNVLNIFKLKSIRFAILICFDMAFHETPRVATENGADILFSPTQIRSDGMKNWEIYLKARALENRIPVVACNCLGKVLDRKFNGNSKIISFQEGYITPSRLKVIEAPLGKRGYAYDMVNVEFPRKMRTERLNEKINMKNIQINRVFK